MSAKLFVGNLHPLTTRSQLEQFFSSAGRLDAVSIPLDPANGQSRGFGFVQFSDRAAAEQALLEYAGRELDSRELRLSWAHARDAGSKAGFKAGPKSDSGSSPDRERGKDGENELKRSKGSDDYVEHHRGKPLKHSGHGSDRKAKHGTRRVID